MDEVSPAIVSAYRERIINFGPGNELVGIATEPVSVKQDMPAVIIVNAGVLHRVGPGRNSVVLARSVAAHEITAFRFDYAGLGDSGFSSFPGNQGDVNTQQLVAAFDELQNCYGINRFVVHGLCSGARDAFNVALADERVVGVSQIDGYAYRTAKFYLKKVPSKLVEPGAWWRLVKRLTAMGSHALNYAQEGVDLTSNEWAEYPSKADVEAGYQKLLENNVKFLSAYTGSWAEEYNYEAQFFDMFPKLDFKEQLTLVYMPHTDHVMSSSAHYNEYLGRFIQFVCGV